MRGVDGVDGVGIDGVRVWVWIMPNARAGERSGSVGMVAEQHPVQTTASALFINRRSCFSSLEYPPPAERTSLGHRSLLSRLAPFSPSPPKRHRGILTHATLPGPFHLPVLFPYPGRPFSHPPRPPSAAPNLARIGSGYKVGIYGGNVVTWLEERGEVRWW